MVLILTQIEKKQLYVSIEASSGIAAIIRYVNIILDGLIIYKFKNTDCLPLIFPGLP